MLSQPASLEYEPVAERRGSARLLQFLPIFQDLEPSLLEAMSSEIEWFALPGGTTLFEAGDVPDAMYCVITGSLGAYAAGSDGSTRFVGQIVAGETVGEMALISGNLRNATVVALRDTELGRLSRAAFEKLMLSHPQGLLQLLRLMVRRLDSSQEQRGNRQAVPKTFAIVPHDPRVDAMAFAVELTRCLAGIGRTELVWSRRAVGRTSEWFHAVERANDFVVYVCEPTATSFSKLCLRQADAVLLLADAGATPSDWVALDGLQNRGPCPQRAEMLLLHAGHIAPGVTQRWLRFKPGVPHHHVRGRADIARVARLLTRTGVGLVLSGGGARGFAHIGVLRALREAGVVVDAIGGTSIGAVIGAGNASEWGHAELASRVRRCFVETNPVNDYTWPLVSFVSGRKVSQLLRREFGATLIEDLPLPYFCVSTNLSTGRFAVHRHGEVWRWLRASVAIPGVLPPVVSGGQLFVDGGTINNLPVDVMREAGLGCVIGVDVGSDRALSTTSDESDMPPFWRLRDWVRGHKRRINILRILLRAGTVNSTANTVSGRALSDLLLQPPLEHIDLLDWQAFDRAIDAGYRYAAPRAEEWARSSAKMPEARRSALPGVAFAEPA